MPARFSSLLAAGSLPTAISPNNRWASLRASSGVQGLPWRPIVNHRWRPSFVLYLSTYVRSPLGVTRNPNPDRSPSQTTYRDGFGFRPPMLRGVSDIRNLTDGSRNLQNFGLPPGYQKAEYS